MSAPVAVRVSASTSNLGSGFDCVGIAVELWLSVRARLDEDARGIVVRRAGTLSALDVPIEEDRLVRGFTAACSAAGVALERGVVLEADSAIPIGKGLGSSAAATVAGALAANELLHLGLDDDAVVRACADVEGHADNVAPAVLGGAALVTQTARGLLVRRLDVHPDIALVIAVPDFAIVTRRARAVLPEFVPHGTAVTAVGRSAALISGLAEGDAELLAAGLDDVLHVPFRRRLVPGYAQVTAAAKQAGAFGATLSGSGSSIVALAPQSRAAEVSDALRAAWLAEGVISEVILPSIVKEFACR